MRAATRDECISNVALAQRLGISEGAVSSLVNPATLRAWMAW
jgi:biotin operon repressor